MHDYIFVLANVKSCKRSLFKVFLIQAKKTVTL